MWPTRSVSTIPFSVSEESSIPFNGVLSILFLFNYHYRQVGPFQIAPGITYNEKWYSRKFERVWNNTKNKIDTSIEKGFFSSRDVSFSLGINTAIFGKYDKFGPNSNIRAIRHVIRPNMSINYKPDMAKKDYYAVKIDTTGRQYRFSYYDGTIFGPFSEGKYGGIGFGIDNNLEAKVKNRKDTASMHLMKRSD